VVLWFFQIINQMEIFQIYLMFVGSAKETGIFWMLLSVVFHVDVLDAV